MKEFINDIEDEYLKFECCMACDLPDACADFGCAIKAGLKPDNLIL